MKIIYPANMRLPTERAHGLATVKMCEALAIEGFDVELLLPSLSGRKLGNIFEEYGVERNFSVTFVPTPDFLLWKMPKRLAFALRHLVFSVQALLYARLGLRDKVSRTVVFSHDHVPLYFFSFFSKNIFYDIHHFPGRNFFYRKVMKRGRGFFVQTKWKIGVLGERWRIPKEKIVYWPNGTDTERFRLALSKGEARRKINLPDQTPIVLYVGALFDWKGVDTLVKAVDFLDANALLYIVGGSPEDIHRFQEEIPQAKNTRVHFIPFRPNSEIPLWLRAADVLVLPNTGKQKVSLYYTSPMKLFEYMASGTPIVASRIPSVCEILDEHMAFFAEADSPGSFGKMITQALREKERAFEKGMSAKKEVEKYTWGHRAKIIGEYFRRIKK